MLPTNQSFLEYIEQAYNAKPGQDTIALKQFTKQHQLVIQGQQLSKIYLIKEGITKCFFYEDNDKEFIVEFLSKGEIIGEIEGIKKNRAMCTVEAITDVEAYSMSVAYFRELLEKDLQFNHLLIDVFAQRIINTATRASFQQLYTVAHSLLKLQQLIGKLDIKLSKDDMAAYLGINIRSLNRALKELGNE